MSGVLLTSAVMACMHAQRWPQPVQETTIDEWEIIEVILVSQTYIDISVNGAGGLASHTTVGD